MTTPRTLGLEDLIRLIDDLRLAGYDIGTQQYINAQRLLITLAARGLHPSSSLDLQPLLAPVLCSSQKEQEDFYEYFPRWLERLPKPEDAEPGQKPPIVEESQVQSLPEKVKLQLRSRAPLVVAAVVMFAALIVWLLWIRPAPPPTLSGEVLSDRRTPVAGAQITFNRRSGNVNTSSSATATTEGKFSFTYGKDDQSLSLTVAHQDYETQTLDKFDPRTAITVTLKTPTPTPTPTTPTPTPTSTPTPTPTHAGSTSPAPVEDVTRVVSPPTPGPPAVTSSTYMNSLPLLALVLPLAIFVIWWLVRLLRRRRMLLQKRQSPQQPRLEKLIVKGAADQLFQGQAFRRTVQELRRHRRRSSLDLDERFTIEATIRRGGLFMPFYGSRKTLPEYLALIERVSARDQQARFEEELVQRLVQSSIIVDQYYFRGDPLICRKKLDSAAGTATYVTLPDLAALHPDYYLLIFSDGASFIDPVTGEPEHWLEQFSPWPGRAILTPKSPAHWRYREWVLQESDFLMLPVSKEGLAALGESINTGTPPAFARSRDQGSHAFPELLRERPQRWLEDHQPAPEKVERLFRQLADYLGQDGLNWLAACAVYPALHWDLTVYLGAQLVADREGFERKLLAIVSLPWLRYGTMPDWFRARLIASLTPTAEQTIRQSLEKLLITFLNPPPDGVRLDYATQKKETTEQRGWKDVWSRFRQWWTARRRRRQVRDILRTESKDSPLQDFVFLTFMSGRHPRPLDVSVPDLLRRVLFPRGMEAFGPRPAAALALAALVSVGGWFTASALAPSGALPPLENSDPFGLSKLIPIPDRNPCLNAPALIISGDRVVNEGNTISFTAAVADVEDYENLAFNWDVTDEYGQAVRFSERPDAAANILIPTDGLGGKTIKAEVSLDLGNLGNPGCTRRARTTTFVDPTGKGTVQLFIDASDPAPYVGKSLLLLVDGSQWDKPVSADSESVLFLEPGTHRLSVETQLGTAPIGSTSIKVVAGRSYVVVLKLPGGSPTPTPPPPTPTPSPSVDLSKPPTILSFDVSPAKVVAGGQVRLCYDVRGAANASIAPILVNAPLGKQCVGDTPQKSMTYILTATNRGQTVSRSVAVEVLEQGTGPVRITRFEVNSTTTRGTQLCYAIENAVSANVTPEFGPVNLPANCLVIRSTQQTTFTLTATGADKQTVQRSVTYNPGTPNVDQSTPIRITSFTPASQTIPKGAQAKICYSTFGEGTAQISPEPGSVPPSVLKRCVTVSPSKTTVYVLTVTSAPNQDAGDIRRLTVKVGNP